MYIHRNARIRLVERAGARDRYGQPIVETVHDDLPCRLQEKTIFVRALEGDRMQIDATLWLDPRHKIYVGDKITMDNSTSDIYNVFSVDRNQRVDGVTLFQTCLLTKQR